MAKDARGHGSDTRGGPAKPIPNSSYHMKSDAELRFIQKDAHEAGRNAQGMGDERGINKYADQVNDASSVLGYRARGGYSDHPADVASREASVASAKSAKVPVHDSMSSGTTDAAGVKDMVYNMLKGMHTSRPDTSRY